MISASRPACSSASCSRKMFPTDFAIFSPSSRTMPLCIQMPRERLAARRLGLGDLVLVVGEDEVGAAAVDVEVEAEDLLGHRRALDVPAGPAAAPRRVPGRVLALLLRLPEREVLRALLQRGGVVALALLHLLERAVRQLPVVGEARDAEVDVALGRVGVPRVDQVLDQRRRSRRSSRWRSARGRGGRARARPCRARSARSSRRASCSLPTPASRAAS